MVHGRINQGPQAFGSVAGRRFSLVDEDRERESVNQEWAMNGFTRIIRCQKGANAIEYALIASLIAVAAITGMQRLGTGLNSMFNNVSSSLG